MKIIDGKRNDLCCKCVNEEWCSELRCAVWQQIFSGLAEVTMTMLGITKATICIEECKGFKEIEK